MRRRKPEELKDSSVEWLADLPKTWELVRMRYLSKIDTGDKDTQDSVEDGNYPFFVRSETIENLDSYSFDTEAVMTSGDGAGVCKIYHHFEGKFALHQRMYAIYDFKNVIGRYIYYSMVGNFKKEVFKLSAKSTVDSLRMPMLKNFPIALPAIEEQHAIATFLDRKTQAIDQLIEKKQQLIEKLKEKRQALITRAVTKGLNPNVPMKDSGIEWLGKIPAHWKKIKLKHVLNYQKGYAFKSSEFTDGGTPVVKATDLKNKTVLYPDSYLEDSRVKYYKRYKLLNDDILMSTVGSKFGVSASAVGQIGLVPRNLSGSLLNQNMVRFEIKKAAAFKVLFIFKVMESDYFRSHLDIYSHGTANQASLNIVDILDYEFYYPPLEEQEEILNELEDEFKRISSIIDSSGKQIKKLSEYRQSLISAAVTGKIDVRDELPELAE